MSDGLAEIGVIDHQGTPVVRILGDVDLSNAHELRAVLQEVGNDSNAAIDLSSVRFIDSTGLNAIGQFGRAQVENGNELFLIVTRPPLRKIFEITSFDRHFTVLESLDDLP